MPAVYTWWS